MSLDATTWAWKQKIRSTHKLVLLSLADRANEQHTCFPSIKRLEFDTGLNRKTIISALKSMSLEGIISYSKPGFGKANFYQLIGVVGRDSASHNEPLEITTDHSVSPNSPKNGTIDPNSPKNGTPIVPKTGLLKVPKTVHQSTIEPPIEPNKEKVPKRKLDFDAFVSPEFSLETLQDLVEHREVVVKAPLLTNRMLKGLLKSLRAYAAYWSITVDDAVDFYLSKTWKGIDPDWKYTGRPMVPQSPTQNMSYQDIGRVIEQKKKSALSNLTNKMRIVG